MATQDDEVALPSLVQSIPDLPETGVEYRVQETDIRFKFLDVLTAEDVDVDDEDGSFQLCAEIIVTCDAKFDHPEFGETPAEVHKGDTSPFATFDYDPELKSWMYFLTNGYSYLNLPIVKE